MDTRVLDPFVTLYTIPFMMFLFIGSYDVVKRNCTSGPVTSMASDDTFRVAKVDLSGKVVVFRLQPRASVLSGPSTCTVVVSNTVDFVFLYYGNSNETQVTFYRW